MCTSKDPINIKRHLKIEKICQLHIWKMTVIHDTHANLTAHLQAPFSYTGAKVEQMYI